MLKTRSWKAPFRRRRGAYPVPMGAWRPLLLCIALWAPCHRAAAQAPIPAVQPDPGTYAKDTVLILAAAAGAPPASKDTASIRYAFRKASGEWGPWIPYRERILLTAAAGEDRSYSIRAAEGTMEREFRYRIDKRPPSPPTPIPSPGRYYRRVDLSFRTAGSERVAWTLEGAALPQGGIWDGNPVSLGRDGELESATLRAYAVDEAGNQSAVGEYRYDIDLRPPVLDLQSPVSGQFANEQTLYVSFRSVEWVRYSLDGSDPAVSGIPYAGLAAIAAAEQTTVKVAALAKRGDMLRAEATVRIVAEIAKPLSVTTPSGAYAAGFLLGFPKRAGSRLRYTAAERTPDSNDPATPGSLVFETIPSIRRSVTIRVKDLDSSGAEYRWFYVLDGRTTPAPQIRLRPDAGLEAWASEDSLLFFTDDGTVPGPTSRSLTAPYPVPSDGRETVLSAVAMTPTSALSSVETYRIPASSPMAGQTADFSPGPKAGGTVTVTLPQSAPPWIVYEVSSEGVEPPEPTAHSPRFQDRLAFSLPYGMEREFRIRFAALDEWGRVFPVMDTQTVLIDREPPFPPVLGPFPDGMRFEEPTTIRAEAAGEVRMEMSSDGSAPKDPSAQSPVMAETGITLPGVDGEFVTYRLKAACLDEWGNASEPDRAYELTVDRRIPQCPQVMGIGDGGRYSDSVVGLKIASSPWDIRFTSGSGPEDPPDPDGSSPALVDGLFFSGNEGTEISYCVKLMPFSRTGKRSGTIRTVRFVIDRKPPEVPDLSGIRDGATYGSAVTLRLDRAPVDSKVSLTIAQEGVETPEPFTEGTLYTTPVTVDVPEGTAGDFTVRVSAEDDVGNRSPIEKAYRFRIDREPPEDPVLTGVLDGTVDSRTIDASFSATAERIVYEMSDDGSLPPIPSAASMAYSAPLPLTGRADAKVVYRILPRRIDEAGNMSPAERIYTLTVDRTLPSVPVKPIVIPFPQEDGAILVQWTVPEHSALFWRRIPPPDASFRLYSGPVAIAVDPREPEAVRLEAYEENSAGVRGTTASFSVPIARKLPPPTFTDVPQGSISNAGLRIGLRGPQGDIRYEIAADGAFPAEVGAQSALYREPLPLDATDGQTAAYLIAARAFGNGPFELPSDEARIRVVVDRTPPAPPTAEGIEDGAHYQDPQRATLCAAEGRIFWTLSEGATAAFQPYEAPILLGAADGHADPYRLRAYTVDDAGNRSSEVREWSVTVDGKVVYVDPAGNDRDDGTRGRPVRSLARALEISRLSGGNSIFAASGNLPMDAPFAVTSEVRIDGGLDPITWKPRIPAARTVLIPDARLMRGRSAVTVRGGSLQASGVEFRAHPGSGSAFLEIVEGEAVLTNAGFLVEDVEDGTAVRLTGGSVSMKGCRLAAGNVVGGALLSGKNAALLLEETWLSGPDDAVGFRPLDLAAGASFSMTGGGISSGAGPETPAVSAKGSRLVLTGARLEAGRATMRAACLDLRDCDTTLVECRIRTDPRSLSAVAVSARGGRLALRACRVDVAAAVAATGVLLKDCQAELAGNIVRGAPSSEYLYLMHQSGGKARLANNVLLGDSSGDSVCLYLADGETDLFNNTVIAGTGSRTTAAVIASGASVPRIVNNILVRRESEKGTAIELIGAPSPALSVLTNDFTGWESLFTMGPAAGSAVRRKARSVEQMESMLKAWGTEGPSSGGNISEAFWKTFRVTKSEEFALTPESLCRDSGTDLRDARFGGPSLDIQGKSRPASIRGKKEAYDMGAEEAAD